MRRKILKSTIVALFTICVLDLNAQNDSVDSRSPFQETLSIRIEDDTIVVRARSKNISAAKPSRTVVRMVPDSVVEKLKTEKEFEYANDPSFWKKEPPPENSGLVKFIDWLARSALVKWILYLFLAAVLIFTLYQVMVVNNFFVFSRRSKKIKADEDLLADETSGNLQQLLETAIINRDYRLATRLLYLQTLQFLSERQHLQLDAKATNKDYIEQMRKSHSGNEFRKLTRIYEYAWYGEYPLSDDQFELIKNSFTRFINQH